jgi:hypothetical protein
MLESSRKMSMIGLLAGITIVASCDAGSFLEALAAARIELSGAAAVLQEGDSVRVTAAVLDVNGQPVPGTAVTWTSSNLDVVEVNPHGPLAAALIARSPGFATVTARYEDLWAEAAVNVQADPSQDARSLTLSPSSHTFTDVGQELQFAVTARGPDGGIVDNPNVNWSSSREGIATVTGEGRVTARALGAAVITATSVCCGQAEVPVNVVDGSGSDLASNLPAGMTLVTDNPMVSDMLEGWRDPVTGARWAIATNREGEIPRIEEDATAPSGNGRVFRQSYAGVRDGYEPMFPATGLGNGNEVFIAMHVKFDERWENPMNSGLKWHLVNAMQHGSSQTAGWFGLSRADGDGSVTQLEPSQGWVYNGQCASGYCGEPAGVVRPKLHPSPSLAGLMWRGEWHKVQYYLSKSPAVVRIWVNDVLVVDNSAFEWNDPAGAWQSFQMGATWGGGIGHPGPENNRIYYDRVMIWRR